MVSYQIFTQTAVKTVVDLVNVYWPLFGGWLTLRIDMIVFVYAFAWVFVLSSIIPTLILGKERSVLVQFIVCLTLTLLGLILVDVLKGYGFDLSNPTMLLANPYTQIFNSLFFAAFYLALPYVFMIGIDIRSKKKRSEKENKRTQDLTDNYIKLKQEQ